MDLKDCLEQRYLIKIEPDKNLTKKELDEAAYDLESAENTFKNEDYKWCIIKAYYSMFHAACAVLFKLGYQEKKHFAIIVVLEDLSKKGKLESNYVDYFNAAMSSREDADYHYVHSKEIAENNMAIAEEFLERMTQITKIALA